MARLPPVCVNLQRGVIRECRNVWKKGEKNGGKARFFFFAVGNSSFANECLKGTRKNSKVDGVRAGGMV